MNDTHNVQEDAQLLRDQLARLREEAEEELAHLRQDLAAVRELAHPERDVDRATEDVALWQELDTLRNALREKERLVDTTAAQCRRLEDELEDHHRAYDGLTQSLEHNKVLLAEARELAATLGREREQLEAQLRPLATSSAGGTTTPVTTSPVAASVLGDRRFVTGLVLGGAVAAVLAVGGLLWARPSLFAGLKPEAQAKPVLVAATGVAPNVMASDKVPADPKRSETPGHRSAEPARPVRDRLRDGSMGPQMLALPSGRFQMGGPRTLPTDNVGPPHEVHLQPFLIGATEVTFEEYDRYAHAAGERIPKDFGWGRGRRPVVDVSWQDAKGYAKWLSAQTGKRYRLPSEAEWEYAARAGKVSTYWWGYQKGRGRAVCFDCGSQWDNRSTAPVASFPPNPFGLYDTVGNVMEWVEDCYHPSYDGAPADGRPWEEANCGDRVVRSGAFNKPAESMRDISRHALAPDTRIDTVGFRLARDD